MTAELRTYIIAKALDDDGPDDVCPGCGIDLEPWFRDPTRNFAHTPYGRWTNGNGPENPDRCEWDGDYLTAREFRRRFIRDWELRTDHGSDSVRVPTEEDE